ncbi:MAG: SH3 domain-containing protein [Flavobacteriaceae bacterium]|nr:SH3 domain-containing protein [Flavobacteriaceae bacterium]
MKRSVVFMLLVSLVAVGQSPNDFFREANNAYNEGNYNRAIQYYDSISKQGVHSVELYFNLANAYYKQNAIAPSILNYEKALLLDADNQQVLNNLSFAQNMTLDRFAPLPENELKKWGNGLVFLTSVRGWALVTIMGSWLAILSFFLYDKTRKSGFKRLYFTVFVGLLFCTVFSFAFALQQKGKLRNSRPAIVYASSESFRSEPNLRSEVLLTIHEGAKVFVLENVEDWIKIRLINGSTGWIPQSSIAYISFAVE